MTSPRDDAPLDSYGLARALFDARPSAGAAGVAWEHAHAHLRDHYHAFADALLERFIVRPRPEGIAAPRVERPPFQRIGGGVVLLGSGAPAPPHTCAPPGSLSRRFYSLGPGSLWRCDCSRVFELSRHGGQVEWRLRPDAGAR